MASRNLGTVSVPMTQVNAKDLSFFVKIDFGAPIGTQRFTDRFSATGAHSLDIDGTGAATWTEAGLTVGPLDQSDQDPLAVSWLRFWNLDYTWTNWANTVMTSGRVGITDSPVQVWQAWFNTNGTLAGSILYYAGRIDNQEHGEESYIALKPFDQAFAREVPWVGGRNLGAAAIMPKPGTTIQWGDNINRQV